jgi:ATP-binding cassette subfamily B protein
LDSENEALLVEALERLRTNRATVVIAHRLSTIRRADRIVVLDHGQITETGGPGELVAVDGVYRRLHDLQFGASDAVGGTVR